MSGKNTKRVEARVVCDACGYVYTPSKTSNPEAYQPGKRDIACSAKKRGTLVEVTRPLEIWIDNYADLVKIFQARGELIKDLRQQLFYKDAQLQEAIAGHLGIDRDDLVSLLWAGDRMKSVVSYDIYACEKWEEVKAKVTA